MKFKSLTFKILSVIATGAIISGLVIFFLVQFHAKDVISHAQKQVYDEKLTALLHILENHVDKLNATGMRKAYEEDFQTLALNNLRSIYYKNVGQRIYPFIINEDRKIILHPFLPHNDDSLKDSSYLKSIVQMGNGEINYHHTNEKEKWCVFKKFDEWNWFVGYAVPMEIKYASVNQLMNHVALTLFIVGVIIAIVIFFIITQTLRPITLLTGASKAMADGDLDYHIDVNQRDELGLLANTFENMRTVIHEKLQDLSLSEERFRLLFNNISNAIFLHDSIGQVLDVNNTMLKLYGVTRNEALSMDFVTHFSGPGNPTENLSHTWQRVLAGENVTFEWNAKKPHSGECFPVNVWLNSVIFDDTTLILATVQDLSLQKIAEKKFLEEKKFSEAVIDTLPAIFFVYADGKRLIRWNKHFEQQSGFSHEQLLNKSALEWFAEKDRAHVEKSIQDAFESGEVQSIEAELLYKSGPVPHYLTGKIFSIDDKQYLIGIGLDLTGRKKLEEELHQAQKMEAIGTLAGGIAHDFNNILAAILGYAELAQEDTGDPEKLQHDLQQILKGSERARNLVQQILTFSRKSEMEEKPLQVSLVVKEALKLLRSSIPTTIAIKQDLSSDALVLADPTQIHQIIMNLCTNAYHAMRETGGTLSVALTETVLSDIVPKPEQELSSGMYLQLTVSDTGTGMDEETKSKIFDPYFTTKTLGEGTGLGLAVVHGVVESHGGSIHVYSEPGQGTTFRIYLPIHKGNSIELATEEQEKEFIGGNETIMLVDDETAILDIVGRILEKRGYAVCTYTNGVQALQEFQQAPDKYDLVITDMTMPHLTGIQLSHQLLEINPEIPIILCTGHSELTSREKSLAAGITEYLEKPLSLDTLLKTVRKTLDKANPLPE